MSELVAAILLVGTALLFSLQLRRRVAELEASQRQAETARRLAEEASELKDEFLATTSHELRTPLNAIVGWVRMLQAGGLEDPEQRRRAIDVIDRNVKVQMRLVDDLLDVSRMVQGRISLTVAPTNLRSIVASSVDSIRPAAMAKRIALHVDEDADVLPVIGDEHRLQQVVWNLLTNAVKYTPEGGSIVVGLRRAGARVELTVRDTGDGIEPAFLPHVFDPFRQGRAGTMRSGLGLGLAIARRLVDLHGGQITALSDGPGRGSEFVVTLPLARAADEGSRPAA